MSVSANGIQRVAYVSSLQFTFPDSPEQQSDDGGFTSANGSIGTIDAGGPSVGGIKGRHTANTIVRGAPRASKQSAIAALTTRVDKAAAPPSPGDAFPPSSPADRPPASRRQAPRAPPLDFNQVKTWSPRLPYPPPRPSGKNSRIFGLDHAPVYYPSIEEFAHPMEYIESIAKEAKQYGICKIVPPEGWRPPFALNTETFRFKTRLQKLNSMEASARASLNFLEQLYLFHCQQGSPDIAIPTIGGKSLNLLLLKREVNLLGGFTQVCNARKWTSVAQNMGYTISGANIIAAQLKNSYQKIIAPFEDYVKRVKNAGSNASMGSSVLDDEVASVSHSFDELKRSNGADTLATPRSENDGPTSRPAMNFVAIDKVRTASDKLNDAIHSSDHKSASSKNGNQLPSASNPPPLDYDDTPGEVCEVCKLEHDPDKIVLCDDCDRGFHLSCLSPPLYEVPKSQFFCDSCLLMNGAEYGFEEGQEHSLFSFHRRAGAFKKQWLEDHPLPPKKGKHRSASPESTTYQDLDDMLEMEDHFEREFWRLVESQFEVVEVEYGADVNYTRQGGGMPNLEVHPSDPYSRDGWNLNNLPILPGSLLRYIKSDISGMTIPWMYVGMVFSTFAWHKEDHYTYSINYHHFGETKTWYGVPGTDDEKLEAAMKDAAPELFEQHPDLMFQLVTLMSPGRLKKNGVSVYACDQRPNEFVITFPRAYHSGFNHGFNFNEAVNFALPDWLPTGLKCVNRYRDIKKNPVFSHDELLVTISQHEKNPKSSYWLLPSWREMVERELAGRETVRRLLPKLKEVIENLDIEEEEFQCNHCRCLSYLSYVTAVEGKKVVTACLHDTSTLPDGPKTLRLRFADDELRAMLAKVKSRSDKYPRKNLAAVDWVADDPRATGRKRKQSGPATEVAGESPLPATQRLKVDRSKPTRMDNSGREDGMVPDAPAAPVVSGYPPPLGAFHPPPAAAAFAYGYPSYPPYGFNYATTSSVPPLPPTPPQHLP
ncbi:JmjC-domain-containing protein [Meredithblackwellia eburnea MCA 4105]